jgi:hypothetical protein
LQTSESILPTLNSLQKGVLSSDRSWRKADAYRLAAMRAILAGHRHPSALDWPMDDQSVLMKRRSGPLLSVTKSMMSQWSSCNRHIRAALARLESAIGRTRTRFIGRTPCKTRLAPSFQAPTSSGCRTAELFPADGENLPRATLIPAIEAGFVDSV